MIKLTESFFREIYFESIIISIFYNFNQRFVEQNEEEILFKFKTDLDNVNKGTNNGRKITCRGILMGEHEYKLVEKVYKLICDKRSKEETPNLD